MFKTRISELLNIQYPILQGGMAWVATSQLAAAVSEAGGLGILGAGNAPAEIIEKEILKVKKQTNKPFGVNIMLLSPFVDEVVDVVCKHNVPVVTTGAGNPGKFMEKFKEKGIKVIPVVPSVALAKRMESLGADAVIVEGTEAGGHVGELTTMVLTPQIVDAIHIPVIAAGGIADGRGFLAALSLGAEGVQMGTRFICAEECIAHNNYKNMVIKAKDRDAIVTARSTGHPVRVLKNKFAKEFIHLEKVGLPPEEIEKLGEGKLKIAVIDGEVDNGSVMAGQIAGMVSKIQPCKEIIEEIIFEADQQLSLLGNFCREA
ncbi:enoyl-[acyl-carrier-protein] reductase FabK [Alkaliphilus oremlandii]|uniref:Probable nitronate monooxygenase n=1 Tax=Alkaliphilus oremlandii (strain OhILAs) TaxID=350688 RepID=A8MHB0_ALKOO|nr:enoyl-[acyl-carrier-protein] reductase FabK [Alkaliphilus oremlandii]ABW18997.1 2-nitropropane dioxygenase NPD [Alkaliphilus oremlandii OhILAs]